MSDKTQGATASTGRFTPGPWKTCHEKCTCGIVSVDDHPICTVEHGEWGDTFPAIRLVPGTTSIEGKYEAYIERIGYGSIDPETAKANTRLISAAPDLYEALKDLLGNAVLFNRDTDACWAFLRDKVHAALAKAEGR